MNRALLIALVPALLVAAGYVFVLQKMKLSPTYSVLSILSAVLAGGIFWLSRRASKAR